MSSRNARTAKVRTGSTTNAFDRDHQRNLKREAVLRAAASAFNRRGYANTSLDDIAAMLGVSKPTLYQYFGSKQEILYRFDIVEIVLEGETPRINHIRNAFQIPEHFSRPAMRD